MAQVIGSESKVKLHFTLKLESGEVVDSTVERSPAELTIGDENLPENFESLIIGLAQGAKESFSIPPEKAFGQHNPNNVQTIGREQFSDMELQEGLVVSFADAAKTELPGVVKSFDLDEVVVDFNHPLAGKTLIFDVEILEVH